MELVIQFVFFAFMFALRAVRLGIFTRDARHRNEATLFVIVEGDIAQLHLAARVVYVFDRYAVIRLGHVHLGTPR